MARIKIGDLSKNQRVSKQEMTAVMGGQVWRDFVAVGGPGDPRSVSQFGQKPVPDPVPDNLIFGRGGFGQEPIPAPDPGLLGGRGR